MYLLMKNIHCRTYYIFTGNNLTHLLTDLIASSQVIGLSYLGCESRLLCLHNDAIA